MDLKIIHEDKDIIVCSKPAGVLAQSGKSFEVDMVSALMAYRRKKGEDTFVGVINRLDRQVSGLMLFAKTKQEAARLNNLMQQNSFNKQYYAVICGKPEVDRGVFVDYLLKDARTNMSKVTEKDTKDAKRAELRYEVIKSMTDEKTEAVYTLVRIHLVTGRHHQIRVQFANRGIPLVGDVKYGMMTTDAKATKGSNSIELCAYSLDIGRMHFEIKPENGLLRDMLE